MLYRVAHTGDRGNPTVNLVIARHYGTVVY
jgi:hypothetical protein